VLTRTATKNQLLGQLDRSFPGLTLALPDVLGIKLGRLSTTEFADPTRLAALGVNRFVRFAAARNLMVRHPLAERLVQAARDALPTADAIVRDLWAGRARPPGCAGWRRSSESWTSATSPN
jgi:hypothetical protein